MHHRTPKPSKKRPPNYSYVKMNLGDQGDWFGFYFEGHFYHVGYSAGGAPILGVRVTDLVVSWKRYKNPRIKNTFDFSSEQIIQNLIAEFAENLQELPTPMRLGKDYWKSIYRPRQVSTIHVTYEQNEYIIWHAWEGFFRMNPANPKDASICLCSSYRHPESFFRYSLQKTTCFREDFSEPSTPITKKDLEILRKKSTRLENLPIHLYRIDGVTTHSLTELADEINSIKKAKPRFILIEKLAPQSESLEVLSTKQHNILYNLAHQHNLAIFVVATTLSPYVDPYFTH
jgi:hypothetical protein